MPKKLTDQQARANVAEWTGGMFVPSVPYSNWQSPWPGVCMKCGQPVKPRYNDLQQGKGRCVYCACRRVDDAVAVGTMMAAGVTPLEPFPGSDKPWKCQCDTCGTVVTPRHSSVRWGNGACNECGNVKGGAANATPKPGQSLADLHPVIAAEAHGWDPSTVKPASGQRKQWKCRDCGHEWPATVSKRTEGKGCPACTERGFNPAKPAAVYVVASDRWLKVGISNDADRRLRRHAKQGLDQVLHLIHFDSGHDALAMEKLWLEYRSGMPEFVHATKADIKDGWTEAVRRTGNALAWIEHHLLPLAA